MKKCPNCRVDVNDNFDLCWNCQYSFIENRVLENSDFELICPNCNSEIDASSQFCANCNFDLNQIGKMEKNEIDKEDKQIDCLRCKVDMEFKGTYKFQEGSNLGGDFLDLMTNRETFNLYVCPNCGKVEFFVPGFE